MHVQLLLVIVDIKRVQLVMAVSRLASIGVGTSSNAIYRYQLTEHYTSVTSIEIPADATALP